MLEHPFLKKLSLKLYHLTPGTRRFGPYASLPWFFLAGAGLELFMNKFNVGEVSLYKTIRRRMVESESRRQFEAELLYQLFLNDNQRINLAESESNDEENVKSLEQAIVA
ncbi:Small integral membrane protein 4, partial [Fragariocoptes setiger]